MLIEPTKLTINSPKLSEINITNQLLAKEVLSRGFEVTFFPSGKDSTGVLLIKENGKEFVLKSSVIQATAGYGVIIARNKYLTYELLDNYSISTPPFTIYSDINDAIAFVKKYKLIVVKPIDTNHGNGITIGVDTKETLEKALQHAKKFSTHIILQAKISGEDYRLLVVGDRLVAAAKRIPANVIGDGNNNILNLIKKENTNPLRGVAHSMPMTKIKIKHAEKYINKHGLDLKFIPAAGQVIYISATANLSQGGEAEDVTDKVHPKIKQMAINAAKVCGVSVCGVDVMSEDISANPEVVPAYIIEINEAPGLRMHHFPSNGKQRNVAAEIIDYAIMYKNRLG